MIEVQYDRHMISTAIPATTAIPDTGGGGPTLLLPTLSYTGISESSETYPEVLVSHTKSAKYDRVIMKGLLMIHMEPCIG